MPAITVRSAKRGIRALQWLILVCVVVVFVDTLFSRPSLATPSEGSATPAEPTADDGIAPPITLAELAPIWERPLRQQLIKPKPKKKVKPPPKPPPKPPSLPKLQATFVEAGQGWGLFEDSKGRRRVRNEGGKVDEFTVVSISRGEARLRHGSHEYDVRVPQRKKKRRKKGIRR